jgi:hypothetical protein
MQTEKYGSRGARNHERLCCRRPAAIYQTVAEQRQATRQTLSSGDLVNLKSVFFYSLSKFLNLKNQLQRQPILTSVKQLSCTEYRLHVSAYNKCHRQTLTWNRKNILIPDFNDRILLKGVGCEVLTAVVIFWDITPCSPLKVNRRFGGTCRLHLQGRIISQARNQQESRSARYLLRLFFDPEDGGDMFLRNVGWRSTDYTAL